MVDGGFLYIRVERIMLFFLENSLNGIVFG